MRFHQNLASIAVFIHKLPDENDIEVSGKKRLNSVTEKKEGYVGDSLKK